MPTNSDSAASIGGKAAQFVTQHYWFLLALIWAAFVVGRLK